jgi:predicted ABC-type sugar transport system permease subunit
MSRDLKIRLFALSAMMCGMGGAISLSSADKSENKNIGDLIACVGLFGAGLSAHSGFKNEADKNPPTSSINKPPPIS